MKISDIILTANRNLLKNKLRSFLTILAIFVGSFTIILNSAISAGVNDFIDAQIDAMGGEGYLEMTPTEAFDSAMSMMNFSGVKEYTEDEKNANKSTYIKQEQIDQAKKIDGVKSFNVIKMANVDYITSKSTEKRYNTSLNIAVDGFELDLLAGKTPDTKTTEKFEIAITNDFIEPLGFKDAEDAINKTVILGVPSEAKCYTVATRKECQTEVEATITGVQANGILSISGPRTNFALWNKINSINAAGMPDSSNQAFQAVAEVEPEKIDQIKDELKEIGLTATTIDDEVGATKVFFSAITTILNIFGSIALVAAAIGIINTLLMSVQERTREIGLMKALGMSKFKIFLSFTFEAVALGFWGSIFGLIVSISLGFAGNSIVHGEGMFLEDLPTFSLVKFTPEVILPIVLLIMFIAFIAGTAPAIRAARKDPIDALRYE